MEMARARFLQHPYRKNDSFGEGLKYAIIIDTFRPRLDFDHFSHSRSRGVQKMKKGIEFSERERHFVEKTLQTRAGRGGRIESWKTPSGLKMDAGSGPYTSVA